MTITASSKNPRGMNIALWILQFILAAMFIMAGVMKSFMPIEQLVTQLPWVKDTGFLVRIVGVSELLGALGLLLPSLLRIKPMLTPIAACGLALIMILALIFHIIRGEIEVIGINIALAGIATCIAWGRFKKIPIKSRFLPWK